MVHPAIQKRRIKVAVDRINKLMKEIMILAEAGRLYGKETQKR
jgi:hypothetical protein